MPTSTSRRRDGSIVVRDFVGPRRQRRRSGVSARGPSVVIDAIFSGAIAGGTVGYVVHPVRRARVQQAYESVTAHPSCGPYPARRHFVPTWSRIAHRLRLIPGARSFPGNHAAILLPRVLPHSLAIRAGRRLVMAPRYTLGWTPLAHTVRRARSHRAPRLRCAPFAVCALLLAPSASAQRPSSTSRDSQTVRSAVASGSATLSGVVRSGGVALPRTALRLLRGDGAIRLTETDSAGQFTLDALPAGAWQLEARRIGYAPHSDVVWLGTGRTVRVEIALEARAPSALDTVRVTADRDALSARLEPFYRRRSEGERFGRGVFYTESDIAKLSATSALDVVSRTRGVRLDQHSLHDKWVNFTRCSRLPRPGARPSSRVPTDTATVFVDGVRIGRMGNPAEMLSSFSAAELVGIEVYNGVAQMPAEVPGECAAIFIWTRSGTKDR